jgi:hypothetical protein
MSTVRKIYDGYKNVFFMTKGGERLADERIWYCDRCEHAKLKWGFLNKMFPRLFKPYTKLFCGKCGCLIIALIRSKYKKCPDGRF